MRLLLLSNSRNPGGEYLAHAIEALGSFLNGARRAVFIPFAAVTMSYDEYAARVGQALTPLGLRVESVADTLDPQAAVSEAQVIVVGGGNSFQLLARSRELGLIEAIRRRVEAGIPYVGWSAGANLACPSIRTTNDMPIVEPPSLAALGLVPFQINPHYTDQVIPNHGGESRGERIAEFLALNPTMRVVGLREGSLLRRDGGRLTLLGSHPLTLFEAGETPRELAPGAELDFLLAP